MDNTVRIDVEGDFDLWDAARSRQDTIQNEATQGAIVFRQFTLSLQDIDFDARLIIAGGREDLALLRWNGSVALDQTSTDTAHCLNTQRQRSDIQQENILDFACQDTGLDSRANGNHLIRVDATVRLAIKDAAYHRLHSRHTCLATDQNDLVNVSRTNARV